MGRRTGPVTRQKWGKLLESRQHEQLTNLVKLQLLQCPHSLYFPSCVPLHRFPVLKWGHIQYRVLNILKWCQNIKKYKFGKIKIYAWFCLFIPRRATEYLLCTGLCSRAGNTAENKLGKLTELAFRGKNS